MAILLAYKIVDKEKDIKLKLDETTLSILQTDENVKTLFNKSFIHNIKIVTEFVSSYVSKK